MRRSLLPVLAVAIAMMSGPSWAFTQEPIRGLENGSPLADPDNNAQPRVAPDAPATGSKPSPFSFSISGPGDSSGPNVNRPSDDNRHLFWNNTSNRFDTFDRQSLNRRQYR